MRHREPIDFAAMAALRAENDWPRAPLIADTPFAEVAAGDVRLLSLLADIQAVHGVDLESCPWSIWHGWPGNGQQGVLDYLARFLWHVPETLQMVSDYLYGQFKMCLHCLGRPPLESDLEHDLTYRLKHEATWRRSIDGDVRNQVHTQFGRADIVTPGFVYEVKLRLSRTAIFQAVGQATIYAEALGKSRIGIAGQRTPDIDVLRPILRQCGIAVTLWDYPAVGRAGAKG